MVGELQMNQGLKPPRTPFSHRLKLHKTNSEIKIIKKFRRLSKGIKPQAWCIFWVWGPSSALVLHSGSQCHLVITLKGLICEFTGVIQDRMHFLPLFWILFIRTYYHNNVSIFCKDINEIIHSDATLRIP